MKTAPCHHCSYGIAHPATSCCCGAPMPQYPDSDVCSQCKEHAEPVLCEHCDGTGILEHYTPRDRFYE